MAQSPRLAARCPVCHTTFRVAADQLKLREGLVRCGKCDTVFNGSEHLLTLPTAAALPAEHAATQDDALHSADTGHTDAYPDEGAAMVEHAMPSTDQAGTSSPAGTTTALGCAPQGQDVTPRAADTFEDDPAVPAIACLLVAHETSAAAESESESESESEPGVGAAVEAHFAKADSGDTLSPNTALAPEAVVGMTTGATLRPMRYRPAPLGAHRWVFRTEPCALAAGAPSQSLPDFLRDAEDRARAAQAPARWLWRSLFVMLALTALAQAAYWWRGPLTATYPALRPLLLRACATLQCTIPPARQLDRLAIDGTQLQKPDDTHDHYLLSLNLRSRSKAHVALPALELVLTDLDDRVIVRRVLLPAEYLPPSERALLQTGLAPDGELALRVRFQSRQTAVNYRVLMFYP